MSNADSLKRAAVNILTRSLGLRHDQSLLIFADASSLTAAEFIARTAREFGIVPSLAFVPQFLQADLGRLDHLPLPVEAAIREADAVLNCLSDRPEHLRYRTQVLRAGWSRRTKLAQALGMTLDVLRKADSDYALISERGRLLAVALILGRQMEIITADRTGREHRLTVPVGGWENPPGVNDGVVLDGTWANLPPGEATISPRGGDGKIAINGAIHGRVFGPTEELLLTFRAGRLAELGPKDSPAAHLLQDAQAIYSRDHGECEWTHLAEIGFGLNPAVRELTGATQVDTKKANTIHIALGRRANLGGDIEAVPHCALVVERPTVRVDGRLLLEAGQWRLAEAEWRLDHRRVTPPTGWWHSLTDVCRSPMRAERDHDRLVCRWNAGHGRWDSTPVGAEPTARLAARLYELLPEGGGALSAQQLATAAERAGIERDTVPELLWVMQQYDVVRL